MIGKMSKNELPMNISTHTTILDFRVEALKPIGHQPTTEGSTSSERPRTYFKYVRKYTVSQKK